MKKALTLLLSISIGLSCLATQHLVSITSDAGAGSLRDQIALANTSDTITFDSSLIGETITLTSGFIAIDKSLTIIGPGYNELTISGNDNSRIFDITDGDVVIKGLKIINGLQNIPYPNHGGAISHQLAGTLTLSNVYFDNNRAVNGNGSQGGAIFYNVYNGTVSVDSCFFMNSQSDNYGGAVSFNGMLNSVTIDHSWFDGNSAVGTCGTFFTNTNNLNVSNSTFSNNSADNIAVFWLQSNSSGLESYHFTNCTISNNSITGNSYREFGVESGTLSLINCTFSNNQEPIYVGEDDGDIGTLIIQNSIFDSPGGNFISSGVPILSSLGGNISSDTTMYAFLIETNDLNSTNPMIDPLSNNGGLMPTHSISITSPARNNGINSGAPTTDQIGATRNGTVDAGSLEYICTNASGVDTQIACNSYTWIDGQVYTSSNNTATFNLIEGAENGCDSIVTLNLTINNVSDLSITSSGITITANATGVTYQWIDCNNGNTAIAGETNQSFTATANGNYAVIVTQNGCSDTSACVAINNVGITENNFGEDLLIYPNPTNGELTIDLGANYHDVNLIVRNTLGQVIFRKSFNATKLLSFNLIGDPGVYLIEVSVADKQAIMRVIKK